MTCSACAVIYKPRAESFQTRFQPNNYHRRSVITEIFSQARAFLFREQLNIYGITSTFVGIFSAIVIWLIIITPLHEILHLLSLSKGKLDDKCIISINIKAVSALYNEHCSRTQYLICLILPFLFLGAILTFAVFLSNGIWRLFFVFLLIMSCYGSHTDIYMFFYVVKHVRKNEMIFGLYKK